MTLSKPINESTRKVWDVLGQPCLSDLDHIIPESFNIPVLDIPRAMYEVQIKMLESQLREI